MKLNLKLNQNGTTVENIDIISSIKISKIHPSINKVNQNSETVYMIKPDKF
jgi:hypothetical protein